MKSFNTSAAVLCQKLSALLTNQDGSPLHLLVGGQANSKYPFYCLFPGITPGTTLVSPGSVISRCQDEIKYTRLLLGRNDMRKNGEGNKRKQKKLETTLQI